MRRYISPVVMVATIIASFYFGYKFGFVDGVEVSENVSIGRSHVHMNFASNAASSGDQVGATLYYGVALGMNPAVQSIYETWTHLNTINRDDLGRKVLQDFSLDSEEQMLQLNRLMKIGK